MIRRRYVFFVWLSCSVAMLAQTWPVTMPQVDGRLKVCGQNLQNYYVVDLSGGKADYTDEAGLQAKTKKIVQAFLTIDADIYGLCELEVNDKAQQNICDAMNSALGSVVYACITDGMTSTNTDIKVGFIYKKATVQPVGSTIATSENSYRKRNRIQLFEEVSTGEQFYLSFNHFKAKDSTTDQGESKRITNASNLLSTIKSKCTADPDVLVMGDLNCMTEETPIQNIINNGYTELLAKYDPKAYSYYYSGNQLIDHALGNQTMEAQVSGAYVFHTNTGLSSYNKSTYRYSDHDAVIVGLNLGNGTDGPDPESPTTEKTYTQDFTGGFGGFVEYIVNGNTSWTYNTTYGAQCNAYNKQGLNHETWLVSPSYDLSQASSAKIVFEHNIYYDNGDQGDYSEAQTLWYSTDFEQDNGDEISDAEWHQITIPTYAVKNWVTATCTVPQEALRSNFHYAFRYTAADGTNCNYWEIKTTALNVSKTTTGSIAPSSAPSASAPRIYTLSGTEVTGQTSLPSGIYIVRQGNHVTRRILN